MRVFKLERYFARYEFQAKYLLSSSDCESLSQAELLALAGDDTRRMWEELILGYTESQGHPLLREEIAKLYDHTSAEDILVAVPEEGIFLAMNSFPGKNGQFLHPFPAYQSLSEIAYAAGYEPLAWPLRVEGGRWSLDLEQLRRQVSPRMRLLVLNFPHNPTGYLPSAAELQEIVTIAREHNLFIFSDEMYRYLEHHPEERLPAICDIYENGVSLGGLSKSFALPGLRVGWLATRHKTLFESLAQLKDYTTICGSAPSEILAIIGLQAKEILLERNRSIVRNNLQLAREFFQSRQQDFQWLEPQGSSIAFPRLLRKIPVGTFCDAVVRQENLMILPGDVYNFPGNHFRIGLGRKSFPEALARLGAFLERI